MTTNSSIISRLPAHDGLADSAGSMTNDYFSVCATQQLQGMVNW